jgi:hypothetical protein
MRVLLARMPTMLRDMFEHEIVHGTKLELCGEWQPALDAATTRRLAPDFVIVGTACPERRRTPYAYLGRWPTARVVTIAPLKGQAFVYELKLQTTDLGRVSPAELVDAIRNIVL